MTKKSGIILVILVECLMVTCIFGTMFLCIDEIQLSILFFGIVCVTFMFIIVDILYIEVEDEEVIEND